MADFLSSELCTSLSKAIVNYYGFIQCFKLKNQTTKIYFFSQR